MVIAESGDAVLPPTIGAAAGVVVRQILSERYGRQERQFSLPALVGKSKSFG